MNIRLLFLIMLLITLFSCNEKAKQNNRHIYDYEVYKTQEILLAEEDRGKYVQTCRQLINIDSKDVLALNMGFCHLSFYELESGEKIRDILVDSSYMMRCYHFVGKDSIFIGCTNLHGGMELETPQALRLIDWDGKVKKIYGYDVDQTELHDYKYDINKLIPPQNDKFVFCRGNIISCSTRSDSYGLLGTKESVEKPLPLGIRMDTKENKYHISKHRKFAYIKEGMYYPTYIFLWITKSANNLPIFRYPYSSSAFEWDFENDSVIEHYCKSALVDSIMPLSYPAEYGYEVPFSYGQVGYDECNQVYVSPIFFNENIYGEIKHGLIFADKNFQYLGEMYDNEYFPSLSNKEILLDIRKKNDSVITVNYLKLVKTDRDYNKYIDSCKFVLQSMKQRVETRKNALINGCPSINFVKSQMDIKESTYKILTLYGEGCIGCDQATLQTLYYNREVLNKVPLYIIVSSNSANELEAYMRNNGLTYYDKVAKDTAALMKKMANTSFLLNPRLTIVKDGIVTLDTIYQAQDIESKLLPQITGPDEYTKYILDENGEVIVISKM
ncbi:MAG: hypothetical protein IJK62_10385 [Bacteroidales bacterium]|nr:hypothetical protein [Bacteroidales bacterium]